MLRRVLRMPLQAGLALLSMSTLASAVPAGSHDHTWAAVPRTSTFPLQNAAVEGLVFPLVGLGTGAYGSDPNCEARPGCMNIGAGCGHCAYDSMLTWLRAGGRRLDLAFSYGNDAVVARAIEDSGVDRSEIFILSKISLGYEDALQQVDTILRDLETDYVDALLIHWPTRGGTGLDPLCNTQLPSYDERGCRLSTWRAMLEVLDAGKALSIGVSNYYPEHLQELEDEGYRLPSINQCPFHLYRSSSQDDVREYCRERGIHFNGYSPLGVPDLFVFPPGELSPTTLEDPRPAAVAMRLGGGVTTAEVLLGWQLRVGVSINPRSISAAHMHEALRALDVARQLTWTELDMLGSAPQIWCSVVPGNYQCAPDPEDTFAGGSGLAEASARSWAAYHNATSRH
jgi:2,5-diketo-D-gluconate reductase A